MQRLARLIAPRFHYSWLVFAVVFLTLPCMAGTRATPNVMILSLEHESDWNRSTISLVISIGITLYGLMGPSTAASMQYFGIRLAVLGALAVLVVGTTLSTMVYVPRQMVLLWGVMVGGGTDVVVITLGAVVVNHWFISHRGLAMGILTASSATGQLAFLPMMAAVVEHYGWRLMALIVASMLATLLSIVWLFLPESPKSIGLRTYGEPVDTPEVTQGPRANPIILAMQTLVQAVRKRDFWLLLASFFVCGTSTNDYIGTHFIVMRVDHRFSEVKDASLLAATETFDLVGTTLSGWLSDHYNSRALLSWYYGLRGLSLTYLPYAFGFELLDLPAFVALYGLDWVAIVPSTVCLINDVFGKAAAPIVSGWTVAGHQLGVAFAILGAGMMRALLGNYMLASMISGGLCATGAFLVPCIRRTPKKDAEHAGQLVTA